MEEPGERGGKGVQALLTSLPAWTRGDWVTQLKKLEWGEMGEEKGRGERKTGGEESKTCMCRSFSASIAHCIRV